MSGVPGMEESPTFHMAVAIELIDASLPFPDRWKPSNIRRAKVLDTAPYRKDQFNWATVPEWGDMEKALFGRDRGDSAQRTPTEGGSDVSGRD